MTNLAISHRYAGKLQDAIELQERSLRLKRMRLPLNDPFVAIAIENLADCYEKNGEDEKAEPLREELAKLRGHGKSE